MVSPVLQHCPSCGGPMSPWARWDEGGWRRAEVIWEEAFFFPNSDVVGSTCIQLCSKDKQSQNRNHIYPSEMAKKLDKYMKESVSRHWAPGSERQWSSEMGTKLGELPASSWKKFLECAQERERQIIIVLPNLKNSIGIQGNQGIKSSQGKNQKGVSRTNRELRRATEGIPSHQLRSDQCIRWRNYSRPRKKPSKRIKWNNASSSHRA